MGLKQIKEKIRGIKKTHQVTKAMEAVSAVKMRNSQIEALRARPYATAALSLLKRLSSASDLSAHPLLVNRQVKNTVLIVITSDKGLAGSLNSAVIKKVAAFVESEGLTKDSVEFLNIGRKGYEYFSKRGYTAEHLTDIGEKATSDELREKVMMLISRFDLAEADRIMIAYTNFVSSFAQEAVIRTMLPLSYDELAKVVGGITPAKGKFSAMGTQINAGDIDEATDYVFEPSASAVLEQLLPLLVSTQFLHSLREAAASEHSARMIAMKNASDRAQEVTETLSLSYNKARQAQITQEVSEIVGGVEAMK